MSIPSGTKFRGVSPSVDTVNKGSATANALRDAYTIEEIIEAAASTPTPAGNTTEVQYNLNGAMSADAGFIRTPKGFFVTQAEGGVLSAETMLGSGDFTEGGQYPIFANGGLFFDDDTNIFGLAGDLTTITGGKGAITMVSEGDDNGGIVIDKDGPILFYQGLTESSTVSADTTEVLLKFEGTTLTTEVSVNDNGIGILYDGVAAYTLPLTDGTAGQVLSTNGAGVLTWITP
jgi:hypothetical protein